MITKTAAELRRYLNRMQTISDTPEVYEIKDPKEIEKITNEIRDLQFPKLKYKPESRLFASRMKKAKGDPGGYIALTYSQPWKGLGFWS